MKKIKGMSLIVTVITIIVMIIVAGAVILILTNTNIIDQADNATKTYNKQQYKVMIGNEYAILKTSEEAKGKTTVEVFNMLEEKMDMKELSWVSLSNKAYINVNDEYMLELKESGEIRDAEIVILDIANGTIQLKKNGYVQGTNKLVEYAGDYIITGTTTENMIKVMEQGTYNIIIKDLNIDVTSTAAIGANEAKIKTGLFVNIFVEGNNELKGVCGINFTSGEPNKNGETEGSTLTIQGGGNLYAQGGRYSSAIGGGNYGAINGSANNIIINSGDLTLKAGTNGCAIGGTYNSNAENIVINGGNINAITSNRYGIGGKVVDTIIINGGNITATGGEYGGAIGGGEGSKNVVVNGGILNLSTKFSYSYGQYYALAHKCDNVTINGGTIICYSKKDSGIYSDATPVIITGGNIYSTGGIASIGNAETAKVPINGEKSLYLTQIQLQNVTEEVSITSFITSDKLTYGIKDMYTTNEGKLYLYLPTGERNITIKAGNKEYAGKVTTGDVDAAELVTLNEK